MSKLTKALTAAAGNAGESLYVEDVFSTYLYTGTGSNQTITNGIDLDGEGGLVWIKNRDNGARHHGLFDTERGATKALYSNQTWAEGTNATYLNAFNSNGFTVGSATDFNGSGEGIASWSFRKAEKFFDVVTWTGNSTVGRTVAHNLGVAPAWMVIKCTNAARNWCTYHVSLGNGYQIILNGTAAKESTALWNYTTPTATEFTLGNDADVNGTGKTYVAYLFASDAGGFGDDGSESIIKCGSFTTDGSGLFSVTLGFEPQWILVKRTSGTGNWFLVDAMRGLTASGINDALLLPNSSSAEINSNWFDVTATGFNSTSSNPDYNSDYIYIAIRRPMKTPKSGTEVFSPSTFAGTDPTPTVITTGFPVDLALLAYRDLAAAGGFGFTPRLTQSYLYSPTTATEVSTGLAFDSNTSFATDANHWNQSPYNLIGYGFKRASGFMDVVAYTGTGVSGATNSHNLGVAPELMVLKPRDAAGTWWVYSSALWTGAGGASLSQFTTVRFNQSNSLILNDTAPTATEFTVGASGWGTNDSAATYIAYLFATVAGVSKIGTYTGTGNNLNVDCGFSAGARFILIKRTDVNADWYVWDSARGIVAGNDPYLLLNSTTAEVTSTDYIDPLASGFTVTSSAPAALNASGGSYIFLAIA